MRSRHTIPLFCITLLAAQSVAQPPSVEIPTGACAGLLKRSSVRTLDAATDHGPIESHYDVYLDFDNLLSYSTVVFEQVSGGQDFARSFVFADGRPFTIEPSALAAYALDFRTRVETSEQLFEIYGRLIPVNGGESFLMVTSSDTGTPFSGVCQKI